MDIVSIGLYNQWWIAGILSLFILILIIAIVIEKRLKKKITILKEANVTAFKQKCELLIKSKETNKDKIEKLDKIAKELFNYLYKIPSTIDYPELAQIFKNKNNPRASTFCQKMARIRYAKEAPTKEEVKSLILEVRNLYFEQIQKRTEPAKNEENRKIEKENVKTPETTESPHILDILEKDNNYFKNIKQNKQVKKDEVKDKHNNPHISSIDDLDRIKRKIAEIKARTQKSRQ